VDRFRQAYVGDNANHSIRKIVDVYTLPENNGVVTTIAGDGTAQFLDGNGIGTRFNLPRGVGVDSVGNVYVGDTIGHRIRKITPAGVVTTFAGNGTPSFLDGTGTNARFSSPWGVAADSQGNIYVGDSSNHRIRKISPLGVVTTLAGLSGSFGDGTGTNARFNQPQAVAVDREGNVYVADQSNHRIRKITPAAVVTTVAGQINPGFANGQGTSAQFNGPAGVAVDSEGNLYVADYGNHRIRRITSGSPSAYPPGVVSTLAGSGTASFVNGTGTNATFRFPRGLTVDSAGNVYVADESNHCIRKITPAGVVTTLAGTTQGFQDGIGTNARFNFPVGMSIDSVGNVYVGDRTNNRIRKIGTAVAQLPLNRGVVTTFAGQSTLGNTDGTGTNARFREPYAVAVDSVGNFYIADYSNHRIRKITPAGVVSTLAGSGTGQFANGTGTNASFWNPSGIAVYSSGTVYVADLFNHRIRKITPLGVVSTLAGTGSRGSVNATGTNASFDFPYGVAVDSQGNVYVADQSNQRIRKITAAGVVTTLTGSGIPQFSDGSGTNAGMFNPSGLAVDSSGTIYLADQSNHAIRKITPAGVVSTLAGTNTEGSADGIGSSARFNLPIGVAVDSDGNVYVADTYNHRIRKITPTGLVTTLAGDTRGFNDGTGTNANFEFPRGVAVDSAGTVYVADTGVLNVGNRIRKIQ
jgi:sugar lactone lactonase YvrE